MDLKKYDIPVPRYTSYPTVPDWDASSFSVDGYLQTLSTAFWLSGKEVSLYLHLPFCESLCTYCACNTRITKNHSVEEPYLEHLLKEWDLYLDRLPDKPTIREIHLGGGTPTFFSAANLERLISGILNTSNKAEKLSMSIEGHPANTTEEHLKTLYDLGFDRLSLGIQDFDPFVQELINRKQSFEQVEDITKAARSIGYTSINYDMVYGLPGQTSERLRYTLDKVKQLSPDRIAYYSYAHVPSMKPAQRSYESHLPDPADKYRFMQIGKDYLTSLGYEEVGLDHFVKPTDELLLARENGDLHRNFMGYTPYQSKLLIGLGVSSISDSWSGFAQNTKDISTYYEQIDNGRLPIEKGHLLTSEDLFVRKQILNLMCDFTTSWDEEEFLTYGLSFNYSLLDQLVEEGLIEVEGFGITVKPEGKQIIRVICSALDVGLNQRAKNTSFSRSI